jgi:hypothetical protein
MVESFVGSVEADTALSKLREQTWIWNRALVRGLARLLSKRRARYRMILPL